MKFFNLKVSWSAVLPQVLTGAWYIATPCPNKKKSNQDCQKHVSAQNSEYVKKSLEFIRTYTVAYKLQM